MIRRTGFADWLRAATRRRPPVEAGAADSRIERLRAALSVQSSLHAQASVRGVVDTVLGRTRDVQPCDGVVVALPRENGRELEVFHTDRGAAGPQVRIARADDLLFGPEGIAAPVSVLLGAEASVPDCLAPLAGDGMRAALVLPMSVENHPCGVLALGWERPPPLLDDDLALLEGFGQAAGIAIANARTAEMKEALANYDNLTGLPNRRIFFDRLARTLAAAERAGHLAAACFIDLDNFKRVNDTMGHTVGDRVLRQVARRLSSCLRQGDTVCHAPLTDGEDDGFGEAGPMPNGEAPDPDPDQDEEISRLGGDEFALLLGKISEARDAGYVARRVSKVFESPFVIDGREIFLSSSIGIAVYPLDGHSAEDLLRNADTAMYCAKRRGRNGFQYYTSSMNAEASRRLHIESRLRSALERDEFEVWYQQKRDAHSGRLIGAEALVRWDDPEMGLVSPAEFIPLAEETGCIGPIGEWVLREVCRQIRDWQDRGLDPLRIAVNLSPNQLHREEFPERVSEILAETTVSPAQLELEVTESAIIEDDEATHRCLTALHDAGIGVALDDFGTGYSSLSHLRRLPLDRIKIDRSFVGELPDNAEDCSLTRAIVAMAQGLGLEVVAEGVETEAQARFLTEIGCHELQGFLFGRPVPAERFEALLDPDKPEDEE